MEFTFSDKEWWENYQVISDNYPKQKEIFFDPTKNIVVAAGTGAGKSTLAMEWAIYKSIYAKVKTANTWIVAPTNEQVTDIYWYQVLNRIKFLDRENAKRGKNPIFLSAKQRKNKIWIRNRLGGATEISLKSAEAEKSLVGHSVHVMVIDEMWKIKKKVWTQHLQQRAKRGNADVLIISTPDGHDFFWELYEFGNIQSPKYLPTWKSFKLNTYDNPMYPQEYIATARLESSEWEFAQQYEASFDTPTGRVYISFDPNVNVAKELLIDPNLPLYMTWDFNTSPMTTSICQIKPGNDNYQSLVTEKKELMKSIKDKSLTKEQKEALQIKINEISRLVTDFPIKEQKEVLYVLKTFYVNNTDSEKQCTLIKQWLNSIGWNNKILIYGDATGGARTSASDRTNWSNVRYAFQEWQCYHEYGSSNPDPVDRINSVNSKLKNADNEIGIYIDANECKSLIMDLQQVCRKDNGEVDKNRLERMGLNHAVEGLGYLIHKRLKAKKEDYKIGITC